MAATEVEDLAALVGIEILPDNVGEEQNGAHTSEKEIPQQPEVGESEPEVETETGETIRKPDLASSLSSDKAKQADKLAALEEEFASRYTSEDTEFMHTLSTPVLPPPCVSPWWSNDRSHDRSRGGRGQGWGRGRGRGRGHYYDNQQHYRDRHDNYQRSQGYHRRDDRRDFYRDRERQRSRDRSPVHRDRNYY